MKIQDELLDNLRGKKRRAVAERIVELERENGRLTPEIVVRDAMRKTSPLHGLFDWNIKRAAYKHWLHTARVIICNVKVSIKIGETKIISVVYARDPRLDKKVQGYVNTQTDLPSDRALAIQTITQELQFVLGNLDRVRKMAVLLGLQTYVDSVVRQVRQLDGRVERIKHRGTAKGRKKIALAPRRRALPQVRGRARASRS